VNLRWRTCSRSGRGRDEIMQYVRHGKGNVEVARWRWPHEKRWRLSAVALISI